MAAPVFVGAGAGIINQATVAGPCNLTGVTVQVGDLVVLQALQDGVSATAPTLGPISGVANLAGTASSMTVLAANQPCGTLAKQHLWVGRATATTVSVSLAPVSTDDYYYRLYCFRGVAAGPATTATIDISAVANGVAQIYGDGGTFEQSAQSFLVSAGTMLVEVRLPLYKAGAPTDNLGLDIQTDSGGVPSGTVVGTVASQAGTALTTTAANYTYACAIPLAAGTYWLVARRSGARSSTNFYKWDAINPGTYADGRIAARVSGVWSAGGSDALCRLTFDTGLVEILENGTAGTVVNGSGATAAITDTGVVTLGADRLALQFVGVDDDNPLTAFAGETGGDWVEATAAFASATGTDAAIQLQIATLASAGTVNGGSQTMAAADNWGVIGFALKPVAAVGPVTVERSAALAAVGLVASIGRKQPQRTAALDGVGALASSAVFWTTFARAAALDAAGLVSTAGVRVSPPVARAAAFTATAAISSSGISAAKSSAAFNATGLITTVGRETLARAAALNAAGLVSAGGGKLAVVSRSAALTAAGSAAAAGRKQVPRSAALTATAAVSVAGVGFTILTRQVALIATGGIAAAGRETLARSAAVAAATLVSGDGHAIVSRQAAVGGTGTVVVAGTGFSYLAGQAALAATGAVAVSGQVIVDTDAFERAANLLANAAISTIGRNQTGRTASLTAQGLIVSSARRRLQRQAALNTVAAISAGAETTGVLERSATVAATGTITVRGVRVLSGRAVVNATATISTVGRRVRLRTATLTGTATVAVVGKVVHVRSRSATLNATGTISSIRLRIHVRRALVSATTLIATAGRRRLHRAAVVTATATVTALHQRRLGRSASLDATATISAVPRRLLQRALVLNAAGTIETIAGGPNAQFDFAAIATVTVADQERFRPGWPTGEIGTASGGSIAHPVTTGTVHAHGRPRIRALSDSDGGVVRVHGRPRRRPKELV